MQNKKVEKIMSSQFYKDLSTPLIINGKQNSRGWYNLIVSIRDVRMYRFGIKPHRNWRISDVKEYFGISGKSDSIIQQLETFREVLMPKV